MALMVGGCDYFDCRLYSDNELVDFVLGDAVGRGCQCVHVGGETSIETDPYGIGPFPKQFKHADVRNAAERAESGRTERFVLKSRWGEIPRPEAGEWCGQSIAQPLIVDDTYAFVEFSSGSGTIGIYAFEWRNGAWYEREYVHVGYW
ncbi:hypothetical protein GCM10010923_16580 [Blastomonas marina]|uniref:Uncharacterized protein n=1 Tax=Blastomonas marina TaxID=1867408 RepID=A0ABQ1FEL7_9SPHN|nr:hypothetical protein [Blastomonas marina]GGA07261.1 hypothetical protein GCM10010923_16580 [Blastomonas marina]